MKEYFKYVRLLYFKYVKKQEWFNMQKAEKYAYGAEKYEKFINLSMFVPK